MKDIAVVGDETFTTGFHLVGVKKVIDVNEPDAGDKIKKLLDDQDIGIIIMHSDDMSRLPENLRNKLELSIVPSVFVMSEKGGGKEAIRHMIKKSIGVDVW